MRLWNSLDETFPKPPSLSFVSLTSLGECRLGNAVQVGASPCVMCGFAGGNSPKHRDERGAAVFVGVPLTHALRFRWCPSY